MHDAAARFAQRAKHSHPGVGHGGGWGKRVTDAWRMKEMNAGELRGWPAREVCASVGASGDGERVK